MAVACDTGHMWRSENNMLELMLFCLGMRSDWLPMTLAAEPSRWSPQCFRSYGILLDGWGEGFEDCPSLLC